MSDATEPTDVELGELRAERERDRQMLRDQGDLITQLSAEVAEMRRDTCILARLLEEKRDDFAKLRNVADVYEAELRRLRARVRELEKGGPDVAN